MAQPRLTWRRALPGLVIIVTMLVVGTMVVWRARVGALRGDTYRLYALANEARGVIKGTEVWIDGKKVGTVADIEFRHASTDTLSRLLLELQILEEYRELVRQDTRVWIRSGGRLISSPVIFLSSGTIGAPVMAEGDTLEPARQSDMETLTSELALAARDIPPIVANIKAISSMASRSRERIAAARTDQGDVAISAVQRDAQHFTRRASGRGTIGLLVRDDSLLVERAKRAMSRADSVTSLVKGETGTVHRFTSDSALTRHLASLRDELSIVRTRLSRAEGSAGRFLHDSAITWQLQRRERAMSDLIEDIKRDPARYIAF